MNDYEFIASRLTEEALLCQIAEEAAELAQAALKMRRALVQDSPTPIASNEARARMLEEIADTKLSVEVWMSRHSVIGTDIIIRHIESTESDKINRWVDRLKAAENKQKEGGENAEEDKQQAEGREI